MATNDKEIMRRRIFELVGERRGATRDLALAIGVSSNKVSDWKAGRLSSFTDYAPQIAEYYNVSLDWLSGLSDEKEQKEKPTATNDDELTEYLDMLRNRPECRMLFNLSKNATKEDVEQAVKIIEALRK